MREAILLIIAGVVFILWGNVYRLVAAKRQEREQCQIFHVPQQVRVNCDLNRPLERLIR